MFKRLAVLLLCLITIFVATFGFVVGVVAVPTIYSYAAVNDDSIYVPLRSESDLVKSFQAYCKSRDLTIEGSLTDAVTTFTTGAFNSACNEIGIDITELQAEIKAEYDETGKPVKFLFNTTGVMAMNRIFAQFLQDNELQEGDSADSEQNTVYDGPMFTDANGYTCFLYISNYSVNNPDTINMATITNKGTMYLYSNSYLYANPGSYQLGVYKYGTSNNTLISSHGSYSDMVALKLQLADYTAAVIPPSTSPNPSYIGDLVICKTAYSSTSYYLCSYVKSYAQSSAYLKNLGRITVNNANLTSVNVYIYSPQINNNNYEGDTYITNEGDVIDDTPVNPGGNDPGWNIGGGEGQATDGNGNTWNITFPDFELPDLNIDWSIQGLGDKFPFSIPFDLVALVTVLNAEPEAPRFEGTVNFGFTTWDYDINLEQFDSVASACRIAELLLLVFGLILITRSIIKG